MAGDQFRVLLAANIREFAEPNGLSVNVLAHLSAISRTGLHFIVAANKAATIDTLAAIADALGDHPSILLALRTRSRTDDGPDLDPSRT